MKTAQFYTIPGKSARSIKVQVPVNPAAYLHVFALDDEAVHGAAEGVYRFKTQSVVQDLLILYANTGENSISISVGEVVAEASMCSVGDKVKDTINVNSVKQRDKKDVDKLFKKLKLNENTVVPEHLKPEVYDLIENYSDVFADENNTIGDTSWIEFKIDLRPEAIPVKQKSKAFSPPIERKFENAVRRMAQGLSH